MHIVNVPGINVEAICVKDHVIFDDQLWQVDEIRYNRNTMMRTFVLVSATATITEDYPSWTTRTITRVLLVPEN